MIRNLPMDVLRTFLTIADLGGMTSAADALGRSQPAISLQIKKLEAQLGSRLFDRRGQRLSLSEDGRKLRPLAQQIITLNDQVFNDFVQPRISGLIRFGIPSEFATALLPGILGRFSQAYSQVTLEITCDLSKNLLQTPTDQFDLILALAESSIDNTNDLVKEDDLVWAANTSGANTEVDTIPLVVAPEPCVYRSRAIDALKKAGKPYRIVYTNPDLTGISAALGEGLGITVLARSTVPPGMRILGNADGLPDLGRIGIQLLYDTRYPLEAVERLADYVRAGLEQS